ncbi:MAG: 8-amino-7-oxononanoate synthase [Rhizobiales bacterium]|nr:8-amino-7-oxononanoate synthase [Hyphomicrobiales bacterium]NRB13729.1 8-amino-7-oxononanoate synthase [Hyphomicrobiales bacterium]
MSDFLTRFEKSLNGLKRRARHRELVLSGSGLDFSSNDYLAMSQHPKLLAAVTIALAEGVGLGATGSRLLRGHHTEHQVLETQAAQFFGSQAALYFANGFMANYALFTCLPKLGDLVIYDELVHASIHDGMLASKATTRAALHNDLQDFEDKIINARNKGVKGRIWLAIESIYSMDGDMASAANFMRLANKYDAFLVVDEAHATGVWGQGGKGLMAKWEGAENLITIHTCGKALGASGAFICAPQTIYDYMVNFSRPFIFSTAPAPLMAFTVAKSLEILQTEPELSATLKQLIKYASGLFAELGIKPSGTQIQPVIIGDAAKTMQIARQLQQAGFDIRGVRPPTVPDGSSRLRITLTLNVTERDIGDMVSLLKPLWEASHD